MHELSGLARVWRVETERAAVGISVAVSHGPGGVISLMIAFEVAVPVDEIARGIAEFLERTENFRARCRPIGRSDEALKSKLTQEHDGVAVELRLGLEQERGSVLVAG